MGNKDSSQDTLQEGLKTKSSTLDLEEAEELEIKLGCLE
jgi:hypothetical protein